MLTPGLSPSVSTSSIPCGPTQALAVVPSPPASAPPLPCWLLSPLFCDLPLEMEGLSVGGRGFPTATCLLWGLRHQYSGNVEVMDKGKEAGGAGV